MRSSLIAASLVVAFAALPAMAQQAPAAAGIVSSSPGSVTAAEVIKASAIVTAIDKETRTVTLKGSEDRMFNVVADESVRNFEQIEVGDEVTVSYTRALSLNVRHGGGSAQRTETGGAARAEAGEKPAGVVGREVTILADVIAVDPTASTITLKGPKGNVVELAVQNPEHFQVVKVGDQVEAEFVEALAISVESVAK